MKSLKTICSVVLLMATVSTYAQDEVIIIDRKNYKQSKNRDIKQNDNTQIIKFSPLQLLAGEINLGYERQISKKGSIDLELGPTISNIGFGLNNHFIDPFNPSAIEKGALGFVAAVGYRYYPLDETEALNRFYVSPVLKFKLMNSIFEDGSGIMTDTQRGSRTMTNFFFNFGYQMWLAKSFSLDFFAGFGIGLHQETTFYTTQVFKDNTWVNEWQEINNSGSVYVGNIGIKIGIGSVAK
jgi:hypothetical protein